MGLATIDPHSLKEHTEIYKIPKFGVNRKIDPIVSKIQPFENIKIYKEMYGVPDSCPARHKFLCKF